MMAGLNGHNLRITLKLLVTLDCNEAVNASNYGVTATYSTKPSNGKYPEGTTVGFSCQHGHFVKGSDNATCVDGEWKPHEDARTRRCPYSCSLKQLKEQQNYDNVWAKLPGGTQDLVPHGTNGYGVCATDPELLGWPELWVCIDGKWGPTRRFRKCPQWSRQDFSFN